MSFPGRWRRICAITLRPTGTEGFRREEFGTDAEDVDVARFRELGHEIDVHGVGGEPVVPVGGFDDAAPIFGAGFVEEDDGHEHDVHAAGLGVTEDALHIFFGGDILPDDGDRFGFHIFLPGGENQIHPRAAHVGEIVNGFDVRVAALRIGELNRETADLFEEVRAWLWLQRREWAKVEARGSR